MVQQDIIIGREVVYQASHTVVVGHIIGVAQRRNGQRLATLETEKGMLFMGDIGHMILVEDLRGM